MEDSIFSPGMDLDYMDELLFDECYLETSPTEGSEFLNPNAFFDPAFLWPTPGSYAGDLGGSLIQGENQISLLLGSSHMNQTHSRGTHFSHSMVDVVEPSCNLNGVCITEASELNRRWWIGPRTNSGPSTSVMLRLIGALNHIKDVAKEKDVLVQLWLPVNKGGRRVLITSEQPFSLDPNSQRLASYRDISVKYQFSAEEDSKDVAGLPGRVFLSKIPEWTPDVRFFRSDEYPRVDHAQQYDVRGTFALPVFEQGSRTCLGVIEVVMTTEKIKIPPELETVCKALEAVNLRSSIASTTQNLNLKALDSSYQAALPEIKEVLRCACETHRLPLAQTWVPCIQQGKEGCRHSIENYIHCVSTVDDACYIVEPDIQGFHEACSEHHLLKGQGVAGRAFMTNQPCFSTDITSFKKTEYPLAHHARMFKLHAAVAIRLRCIHTGKADFVLEFFLPADCRDPEGQKEMLNSLSSVIQQVCRSLRVVTNKELEEETDLAVSEVIAPSDGIPSTEEQCTHHSEKYSQENPSSTSTAGLTKVKKSTSTTKVLRKEKARVTTDIKLSQVKRHQQHISLSVGCGDSTVNQISFSSVAKRKTGEKRRSKAEETITLQVLRQYFAGSLKEAAKGIGVCPTTLKRICRQHGIKRWPSRTIKKVGHNLQKLQHFIDSVQGVSGAFHVSALYPNFPEMASPRSSGKSTLSVSTSGLDGKPKQTTLQPEGGDFVSQAATSNSPSSSCSQNSDSSHICSSGTHQPSKFSMSGKKGLVIGENLEDGELKMVTIDAELHASSQEGLKLMPRSESLRSLKKQLIPDSIQPIIIQNASPIAQDLDAQRVKVTYGDVKIRFRMQSTWRFKDLLHEIARRFKIDDISGFDLKYFDDDSEWVLLTCDADLEECTDVSGRSEGNTIKLLLQVSHRHLNQSSGSTTP